MGWPPAPRRRRWRRRSGPSPGRGVCRRSKSGRAPRRPPAAAAAGRRRARRRRPAAAAPPPLRRRRRAWRPWRRPARAAAARRARRGPAPAVPRAAPAWPGPWLDPLARILDAGAKAGTALGLGGGLRADGEVHHLAVVHRLLPVGDDAGDAV